MLDSDYFIFQHTRHKSKTMYTHITQYIIKIQNFLQKSSACFTKNSINSTL